MGFKVMFVDDEPELLKLFKALAEPLGCEVLTITDSQEAAQRISKEKFDGVFLDAMMPGLDGFELAKRVRSSSSNSATPIAMLTGSNDVDTMRKGFQVGVTFFLGKPLSQQRLVLLLRTMRGSLLREKRRYARLPIRVVVTFRVGSQAVRTESVNISESGMLIERSGGAPVGFETTLEFVLPQPGRPLKLRAKVVRKDAPDLMAVQFQELKVEDHQALQEFVNAKIPE